MEKKKKACSKLVEDQIIKAYKFLDEKCHPSFVDEAPEDQSRKESIWEFARGRFVCWHRCFSNKLAAKQNLEA
jgi:hypothetical protein